MFYGTLILAKKGPLAKVWLAAHWDKKLTKAHVFETDVESTVDNIISPGVKLALRTSGHLLLGVVRIYSRKQKYLIQDLGEACAKIKMAFRPGIIDLPSAARAENPDALILPEVFHNFDDTTADMQVLEAQFTVNPSRVSEINIPDDTTASGGTLKHDFENFDMDFGGGMQDIPIEFQFPNESTDIEVQRKSATAELIGDYSDLNGDDSKTKNYKDVAMEEDGLSKTSPAKIVQDASTALGEEIYPDAINDFGKSGDGYGMDGFGMDIPDLVGESRNETELSKVAENGEDEPMEVEEQPQPKLPEQPAEETETNTTSTAAAKEGKEDSGFVLEPLEVRHTVPESNRQRKKRRVVVDNDKEFSGQQIKSQFEDFKDLLQPKCFPPPTKKAMMWREMAGCEQLYSHPTYPAMSIHLVSLIKANYTTDIPGELPAESLLELDKIDLNISKADSNTSKEQAIPNEAADSNVSKEHTIQNETADNTSSEHAIQNKPADSNTYKEHTIQNEPVGEFGEFMEEPPEEPPEEPANDNSTLQEGELGELAEELSDELGQKRWTKRTQQVLRSLEQYLENSDKVEFSSLTAKCDRKQAASQFYTCLLLAKEGIITLKQLEPYEEIQILKGPKFT